MANRKHSVNGNYCYYYFHIFRVVSLSSRGSEHHAVSELQRLQRYRRQPEGVKILTVLIPARMATLPPSSSFVRSSRLDSSRPGSLSNLEVSGKKPEMYQVRSEEGQASPVGARGRQRLG